MKIRNRIKLENSMARKGFHKKGGINLICVALTMTNSYHTHLKNINKPLSPGQTNKQKQTTQTKIIFRRILGTRYDYCTRFFPFSLVAIF